MEWETEANGNHKATKIASPRNETDEQMKEEQQKNTYTRQIQNATDGMHSIIECKHGNIFSAFASEVS